MPLQAKVTLKSVTIQEAALIEATVPILQKVQSRVSRRTMELAKRKAPRGDSGNLREQIREDEAHMVGPFTLSGGVTSHADYSAAVHEGSRPHEIRARAGGELAFPWHGKLSFFKHVNHPGSKPNPFLRDAAYEAAASDPDITFM